MSLVKFWFEFFSLGQKKIFFPHSSPANITHLLIRETYRFYHIYKNKGLFTKCFIQDRRKRFAKKTDTGGRGSHPKMISPTQNSLYPFLLQLSFCFSVPHRTVILQWATKTTLPRGYWCVWYVVILKGPKH